MNQVVTILGALSIGSLIGVVVKARIDRNNGARAIRREFYVQLLALLLDRKEHTQRLSFDTTGPKPPDIDQAQLNTFNATLLIDASPEVREMARTCFNLLQRFWISHDMQVPIDVDEHGIYHHRFDKVAEASSGDKQMAMRFALGELHQSYSEAVDRVAAQVRKEVHGEG